MEITREGEGDGGTGIRVDAGQWDSREIPRGAGRRELIVDN
jgi:hypothetical protein